jgi:hypothetical protein
MASYSRAKTQYIAEELDGPITRVYPNIIYKLSPRIARIILDLRQTLALLDRHRHIDSVEMPGRLDLSHLGADAYVQLRVRR